MSSEPDDTQNPENDPYNNTEDTADPITNADDLDDYLKRAIHEHRQRVLERVSGVDDEQSTTSSLEDSAGAPLIYSRVNSYLLFIEQAVRVQGGKGNPTENKYFIRRLGDIRIQPPTRYYVPRLDTHVTLDDKKISIIGGSENYPDARTAPVHGLFGTENTGIGFLDLEKTISEQWQVPIQVRHNGQQTAYGTGSSHVPRRISIEAFRLGNEFVTEEGLGLVDRSEPDAKFEYTDLDPPDNQGFEEQGEGEQ